MGVPFRKETHTHTHFFWDLPICETGHPKGISGLMFGDDGAARAAAWLSS